MMILFLGPESAPLLSWLRWQNEDVIQTDKRITLEHVKNNSVGFIISHGYRHLVNQEVIDSVSGQAINLHISYLPWNRGADPNLWSFIDETPKGVTIHYIDTGLDTGDIIAQKLVEFTDTSDTLASTYSKLQNEIEILFKMYWPEIKCGTCSRRKQPDGGTFHKSRDKEALSGLLMHGWNTPISALMEYAARAPSASKVCRTPSLNEEKRS